MWKVNTIPLFRPSALGPLVVMTSRACLIQLGERYATEDRNQQEDIQF
jgi:hypothetical protein